MAKKKEVKAQGIWEALWEQYKADWKKLWDEYKSIIIPFIEGTCKYVWQLVYGLLELVIKGLYQTGKYYLNKLIEIIKRA